MTIASDTWALSQRWNQFGFDLWREMDASGNAIFSPLSIAMALSMLVPGARGATRDELVRALRIDAAADRLAIHVQVLLECLSPLAASRSELSEATADVEPTPRGTSSLHMANALFPAVSYPLHSAYVRTLEAQFRAHIEGVDYSDPPSAAERINTWVTGETHGLIPWIVRARHLGRDTRMVLVNAVHFLAGWTHPFDEERTRMEVFTLLDGGACEVPLMRLEQHLAYAHSEVMGVQAVLLPYGQSAMLVLLPDEGRFSEFAASFDAASLSTLWSLLEVRRVRLWFPRFEMGASYDLRDPLQALGLEPAFSSRANFSGITPHPEGLQIGEVLHTARITVDEHKTEAAAVTVATMVAGSLREPPPPVTLRVDRPFLFAIRDYETESVLFMGRVLDPTLPA